MTRAIRRNVFGFPLPDWSDDTRQILAFIGERRSDAVAVAIRKGSLRFAETLDWSPGFAALETAFALNRRLHLFRDRAIGGLGDVCIDPQYLHLTFNS